MTLIVVSCASDVWVYFQDTNCFMSLQPFLLGKAKVPFRQWLMAGASSHAEAAVTSSVVGQREGGGEENSTNKDTVGKLAVRIF